MTRTYASTPTWTIPAQESKVGRQEIVPLSPAAVAAIQAVGPIQETGFVISSTQGQKPVSGYSKLKLQLDARIAEVETRKKVKPRDRVSEWHLHLIRHSVSTLLNERGIRSEVVEAVLGHISGHKVGVAGVYNHARYAVEVRQAMDLLADIVTGKAPDQPSNVVPIRAGA